MAGALERIKVIDVGQLVQGPQAAAMLADMGADVIKVELPGIGDFARLIPLSSDDTRSAFFIGCNRGKRSLTVDLRTTSGAAIFKRLSSETDIIVSNFKPGTLDTWGLGYETLRTNNPGLIWGAGSTFGPIGPDADREGADMAGQAAGGLISTVGEDGHSPSPVGATIADHIASQNLLAGILAALVSRNRTGQGQRVEVSLLGGQIWAQASEYSHFLLTGKAPGRSNLGHPLIKAIYRIFETSDGWLGIVGMSFEAQDAFFIALGCPELAVDPRYNAGFIQPEDLKYLFDQLEPVFRRKSTDEWSEILRDIGVRYAPVRDYQQTVADKGAWENGYFQELDDTAGGKVRCVGTPIAMSGTPLKPQANAPELGHHTDQILSNLGYSAEDIAQFRHEGAV